MSKFIVSFIRAAFFVAALLAPINLVQAQLEIQEKASEKAKEPEKTEIIKGVKKVFVHFPGEYSIMYLDGKELKVLRLNRENAFIRINSSIRYQTEIVILLDAEPGHMWTEIQMWNKYYFKIVIHVDSPDAFSGASYNYSSGKQTREGQTEVIR